MPTKRRIAVELAEAIEVVVASDAAERFTFVRPPWRNLPMPKAVVHYLNWIRIAVIAAGTAASMSEHLRNRSHRP